MAPADSSDRNSKLMRTNTSGYRGVSWNKASQKWAAYIKDKGVRRFLGQFATPEQASAAYIRAAAELRVEPEKDSPEVVRAKLLDEVRALYGAHGFLALSTPFLEKQKDTLYPRLLAAGLNQPALLAELGLAKEYSAWRNSARTYRGRPALSWSWEVAVEEARKVKERIGDLPTKDWFGMNSLHSLVNTVYESGHTWENLRDAVGCFRTSSFQESRNGMRWRSRPEASLSNFLYARGIQHKRGERYADGYSEQSGRSYGRLDLHFVSAAGEWIDVEIWGDQLNGLSGGRYAATRAFKERWQTQNANFLGIPYKDCLSDARLTEILKPYIGTIAPFHFDKPSDRAIETSHWSDADELLASCKAFAAQMPDGIFPSESWLRKRGKYMDRSGSAYNTMAVRVNQWFGGTRKLRELLGQSDASTTVWTRESAIAAWKEFYRKHGLSPSQCKGPIRKSLPPNVAAEASRICAAVTLRGVLAEAREGEKIRTTKSKQPTVRDQSHGP